MFSLNVDELQKRHEEKCKNRMIVFNKILEKCYYRINKCAENNNFCLFPVPEFILGVPKYSMPHCAAYIMHNLKKNGFMAQFFNPNLILIIWIYRSQETKQELFSSPQPKLLDAPTIKTESVYRTITDYKSSGNFLYN